MKAKTDAAGIVDRLEQEYRITVANLRNALKDFIAGVKLDGALLDEAMAFGIDFSNCSLRGAKLRHANLRHALFLDANLDGAELQGARLGGARFDGAILTGVNVARLGLPAASGR